MLRRWNAVAHLIVEVLPIRDYREDKPGVVLVPSGKRRQTGEEVGRNALYNPCTGGRKFRFCRQFKEVSVTVLVCRYVRLLGLLWLVCSYLPSHRQDLLRELR